MYRRPTKKQLLISRIITYTIMVFSVFVIVTGTVLFIQGYRIDGNNGSIEQGALVQFESKPGGGKVFVDGKYMKANTPLKRSIVAGMREFMITKPRYESWTKTINITAGTLEWLDYVRLVPKELPIESIATYETVYGEKASPDKKWLMVQESADTPTFQLVDLRSQEVKTSTIELPAALYSDAAMADVTHVFTMLRWDEDGRYMIVKHAFSGKSEYLIIDTQDASKTANVSKLLGVQLSDLQFSGTSGSNFYGLTDGVVRELDLPGETISRGLISSVKQFDVFDSNTISYTGTNPSDPTQQVAGLYRDGDASPRILRVVNDVTTPVTIDYTQYFRDEFVVISEGLKVTVLKGSYPSSSDTMNASLPLYAEFNATADVTSTNFSKVGDRLIVQSGLNFVSYEVEYKRETAALIETGETTPHLLRWLDGAYLWAVYDGHLSIREFDGTNTHVIMNMEPGFDATLSQNGKYIYGMAKSDGTYHLQRVTMILN
jgi:hypothetical protein